MTVPTDAFAPAATTRDALALAAGAAFAAVLLSPLRHYTDPATRYERDSFPLSTYPMFSEDLRGRAWVPHVIGWTAAGERVVPHYSSFGAGGLNQVRKQVARMVQTKNPAWIAQQYADALAASGKSDVVTVEVVKSRFVFDTYFAGNTRPQREKVVARCEVGGHAVVVNETRYDADQPQPAKRKAPVQSGASR